MKVCLWSRRFCASLVLTTAFAASLAWAAPWPVVNPAELSATASIIDPDASVEVLSRELTIDDSPLDGTRTEHYQRIKIFNKAGVDKLAKIEIPFDQNTGNISYLEARTIKPDGRIVELRKADVFERDVVKQGNIRLRVKSFSPPALEPGAIVEYRYDQSVDGHRGMYPLLLQGDSPVRSVKCRFRPLGAIPGLGVRMLYMNIPQRESKADRNGFYEFSAQNLPAMKDEPMQPPKVHLVTSVVVYYEYDSDTTPEAFWSRISEKLLRDTKSKAKVTKNITATAQRLVGAKDSDEEKLRKLHDYCRTSLQNRSSDASGLTREQRRKLPSNSDADDTLKNASGSRDDINILFVALARALGLDARLALANDRNDFVFSPKLPVPFVFVRQMAVAKVGGKWTVYDPGSRYFPAGMCEWRYSDTVMIIANEKGGLIEQLNGAPAASSLRSQSAKLEVKEDGSLEGDVAVECTGYFAYAEKNALDAASKVQAEKRILAELEPHLKGAEVTAVEILHAADPLEPIRLSYHLRVPEFAERTGSRLFVQPSVFRRGVKALFEAPKRHSSIVMNHRFIERDQVELALPEGVTIEAGSAPAGLDLGLVGHYEVGITWTPGKRVARLSREFQLSVIGFSAEKYQLVKRIFETIQARDDHTLSFRFAESAAAEQSTSEKPASGTDEAR